MSFPSIRENLGIFAVILASGQSTRMGEPKLLLPFKGMTIIEHLLKKMATLPFEGTKIVIPEHNEQLRRLASSYYCQPIINTSPQLGMGKSLSLAINSLPTTAKASCIFLGDQPKLAVEDILKVWDTYKEIMSKQNPKLIIQTKYHNGQIGHPILFTHHFFDELKSLNGDIGGKEIIIRNKSYLLLCKSNNEYPKDVDTPDDYEQLLKE